MGIREIENDVDSIIGQELHSLIVGESIVGLIASDGVDAELFHVRNVSLQASDVRDGIRRGLIVNTLDL